MRKYAFGIFATVVIVVVSVRSAFALVINEIMYDLPGADDDREWVEVFNDQSNAITVATGTNGWRFYDGANHIITNPLQGSSTIPAGGFAILADDAAVFLAEHANFFGTLFDTVMSLANTADTLRLVDEGGMILHEITYQSSFGATGNGKSLERQADSSYQEGSVDGGTPGAANSTPATPTPTPSPIPTPSATPTPSPSPTPTPSTTSSPSPQASSGPSAMPPPTLSPTPAPIPSSVSPSPTPVLTPEPTPPLPSPLPVLYINEFFPNTQDSDLAGEWIELWNPGSVFADISGWKLDDTEGGFPPHTMPSGTILASGEYRVFWRTTTGISLNNDVDVVRLITPGGQLYASVSYEKPPQGASSNRTPSGAYVWSWTPTPGSPNRIDAAKNDLQPNARASSSPRPSTEGSNSSAPSLFPAIAKSPEVSINPRIAKTDYLPASSPKTTKENTGEEKEIATTFAPFFLTTSAKFSANLIDTAPQAYRSFFSRHALIMVMLGALAGVGGLIRWKRAHAQTHT